MDMKRHLKSALKHLGFDKPRKACINRSDSATYTDFFRHRAGDFLPPNRSTLPLKAQPVQALAEQVSIF